MDNHDRYGQSECDCECGGCGCNNKPAPDVTPLVKVCRVDTSEPFFVNVGFDGDKWIYTDSQTDAELTAGVDFKPCAQALSAAPALAVFQACKPEDGHHILVNAILSGSTVNYQDVLGQEIYYEKDFVFCATAQPVQPCSKMTSTTICVEFCGEIKAAIQHIEFVQGQDPITFQTWEDGALIDPPLDAVPCPTNVCSSCCGKC